MTKTPQHGYQPPTDPADPVAAALDVVVRLPELLKPHHRPPTDALQELAAMLDIASVFAGLTWPDAKTVAAVVVCDAIISDAAAAMLQKRAAQALSGADHQDWRNSVRVAQAFWLAAEVLA